MPNVKHQDDYGRTLPPFNSGATVFRVEVTPMLPGRSGVRAIAAGVRVAGSTGDDHEELSNP